MTHQEFADFTEQVFDRVRQIAVTKGKEYADDENNRFANFDTLAKELEISPFKVWWCYVGKMLFAIKRWLRTGATLSESIEERFLDVIVYTLLAWGMARRQASEDARKGIGEYLQVCNEALKKQSSELSGFGDYKPEKFQAPANEKPVEAPMGEGVGRFVKKEKGIEG